MRLFLEKLFKVLQVSLFGARKKKRLFKKVPSFVIMRFSALGDVALCVPVLMSLLASYPERRFVVVTRKKFAVLFQPLGVQVLGVDLESKYFKGIWGMVHLGVKIKKKVRAPFIVLDWHNVLRTKLLGFFFRLCGHKAYAVSKNRRLRRRFLAPEKKVKQLPSVFERYGAVAERAGCPLRAGIAPRPYIKYVKTYLAPDRQAYIYKWQKFFGRYIIMAPFAAYPEKCFPVSLCEDLLGALAGQNIHTVVVADDNSKEDVQLWQQHFSGISLLSDLSLSLTEEVLLFSGAAGAVVADSANMHLSGLAGIPMVSVWGGTAPGAGFSVWTKNKEIFSDLSCQPCSIYGNKPCIFLKNPYICVRGVLWTDCWREMEKWW